MNHSSKSIPVLPALSTQSTDDFFQSLETITAYIKEFSLKASQPPQSPPTEYNLYYSENDSSFDSEYYSDRTEDEYDSDYFYGELVAPEQQVQPSSTSSPMKEVESIATIYEERTSTKKIDKKPEAHVGKLNEDFKKVEFYDIPTSKNLYNEAALFATNSTLGFAGTSRSNDLISPQKFDDSIYVFIDNSNILVGFSTYCQSRLRNCNPRVKKIPMLDYGALFKIIEKGRNVKRKCLAASKPLSQPLKQAEKAGYECSVLQRINQREQCVDEVLQLKIYKILLETQVPSTLVLASGDGNDAEYNEGGFYKCIKNALERGWKVEIISWKRQLNKNFTQLSRQWRSSCQIIHLDTFASKLGFKM
ncbi:12307_t:CDS:2 [Funneliformis geosporum]|uniref:12307_t:CDS:1 n=1 Tax=Funneliformis geosporum TaxID=1117311 RepID=A0A9W4SFV3_9GLOM|nr:12307_t:CDS:2 [Funneliformis geosporum]